jgi:hypothetical protein
MPGLDKTIELNPTNIPKLTQIPQAIEMKMEDPNSFIEDIHIKKQENLFNSKIH